MSLVFGGEVDQPINARRRLGFGLAVAEVLFVPLSAALQMQGQLPGHRCDAHERLFLELRIRQIAVGLYERILDMRD